MLSRLARFDVFSKSKEQAQVRTTSGAIVSSVTLVLMGILLVSEFTQYFPVRVEDHLMVDAGQGDRDFDIRVALDFPSLKCASADLRAEDAKGIAYEPGRVRVAKAPLHAGGAPSSPDGGEAPGCALVATLTVRKVAGNFHVAAGHAFNMMDGHTAYSLGGADVAHFNVSHTVRSLSFGPPFPSQGAPLDRTVASHARGAVQHQYHIKAVPTIYEYLGGSVVDSMQFTATDFVNVPSDPSALGIMGLMGLNSGMSQPGVWFRYDFSPIMIRSVETRASFLTFLVSVCAILGGLFTLVGLVDTLTYRAIESRKGK